MSRNLQRGAVGSIIGLAITLLLIVGAAWVLLNRQFVIDQIAVWQFKPSSEVTQLARDTTMTSDGTFIFYATQPEIATADRFNADCKKQEEGNAILGCYKANRIFIYNVQDERLNGIKQVTAAHEMLHAVYQRLSEDEKKTVSDELEKIYATTSNAELKKRMEYYDRTEPGQRHNELHSILGTEFSELSPKLEDHYKKYFSERQSVVALYRQYNTKFTANEASRGDLKTELEALSVEINTLKNQYDTNLNQINNDIETFNARARSGAFSGQAQFQTERSALLAKAESVKSERQAISDKIALYEEKRQKYNALVDESNSMTKALDSSLAPAPSL